MFGRKGKAGESSPGKLKLRCSFCGKSQDDVAKLIAGPSVQICDECVAVCVDILTDDRRADDPGGQAKATQPRHHIRAGEMRWPSVLRCALCKMPVVAEEAMTLEGRGLVCMACVADVQAAAANLEGSREPPEGER